MIGERAEYEVRLLVAHKSEKASAQLTRGMMNHALRHHPLQRHNLLRPVGKQGYLPTYPLPGIMVGERNHRLASGLAQARRSVVHSRFGLVQECN